MRTIADATTNGRPARRDTGRILARSWSVLLDRREFLRIGAGTTLVGAALLAVPDVVGALAGSPITRGGDGPYGPLGDPDELGFRLPEGFRARELARGNEPVAETEYLWHVFPDGGATFPAPRGGWTYVSNSEAPGTGGGVSALRFSTDGELVDAYRVLEGTGSNCAGGATPWGTWLSGEEHAAGQIWECDPRGGRPGVARAAMGRFEHEAAAVDPERRHVYLTEDESEGRFYRFTPRRWKNLDAGTLEVAVVADNGRVRWREVPDAHAEAVPTREQVPESTPFDGGEGIVYDRGVVYFSTKGDNKVWAYDTRRSRLEVLYDGDARSELPLRGVDNLGLTPRGDLVVAEDGDDMELVVLTRSGVAAPLLQLTGQEGSELAGPAFSPDGRRLYFSSQRGGGGPGITYEVTGPFRRRR